MSGPRNFDGGEDRAPKPFVLGGVTYVARPAVSLPALARAQEQMETVATAISAGNPNLAMIVSALDSFFGVVLMKADQPKFHDRLFDEESDDPFDILKVMDVVSWLQGEYLGKIPGLPASSSAGQPDTTEPSTDDLSLPDTPEALTELMPATP